MTGVRRYLRYLETVFGQTMAGVRRYLRYLRYLRSAFAQVAQVAPDPLLLVLLVACTRPSQERAEAELSIGAAELADTSVRIEGGLAAIHELADYELELWSQSPDLTIELVVGPTAVGEWTITVRNSLPDAVLVTDGAVHPRAADQHPTTGVFTVTLAAGTHLLRVAPPDADMLDTFRVAAMADIQKALPTVHEVFAAINATPDLRFVVAMGDITERSELSEYDLFDRQLQTLQIPYYTTLGNHELWADFARFHDRYGRASFQFTFKGVSFTFADSGDGGIDPLVEEQLDDWLAAARDDVNIYLSHFPPLDPQNARYGGFRSTDDARRLLSRLAAGNVDLTLYGHIHTYIEFENAGIPAYVSGGGGAQPMKWDGIDRHFLVVEADAEGIRDVSLRRVD